MDAGAISPVRQAVRRRGRPRRIPIMIPDEPPHNDNHQIAAEDPLNIIPALIPAQNIIEGKL